MKAKKPLLVTVLVLALLAVALVLPAAALSANGNQPVAWVSAGGNGNNASGPDFQAGWSVMAKEFTDGSVVGHAAIQSIKYVDGLGPQGRYIWSGTDFTSLGYGPWFWSDEDNRYAAFYAPLDLKIIEGEDPADFGFAPCWRFLLIDSGEPGIGADYMLIEWMIFGPFVPFAVPGYGLWGGDGTANVPVALKAGNVQIHFSKDYEGTAPTPWWGWVPD